MQVLRPGLVKGPWTREEDDRIVECIKAGITKWSEIAASIPGRIGKQCRERWCVAGVAHAACWQLASRYGSRVAVTFSRRYNHLDPNIKKTGWTEEEDLKLQQAVATVGASVAVYISTRNVDV